MIRCIHDVCIQNLPVDVLPWTGQDWWEVTARLIRVFLICHYLSCMPNMSVMAPKNRWELEKMLQFAISYDGPIAIRYPRGEAYRWPAGIPAPGRVWQERDDFMRREGSALLAVGSMVKHGRSMSGIGLKRCRVACTLVNATVCEAD